MHDPFFPPLRPLQALITPLSTSLNLHTLPLHIHEVLIALITYHLIFLLSGPISTRLFPLHYPSLPARTRINWDVHVVSLVQSTFISILGLYVLFADRERAEVEHPVFGYTGLGGALQAFALGYFVWDLAMSARYFDVFGIGFLMHAASAVVVFALGFRPFVNSYGPIFVLFELSSPMLNFHWFFDKLRLTGSKPQLYNGLLLIITFFCCRIVWGPIQSFRVFRDVYAAYMNPPRSREEGVPVPMWLAAVYLGSNVVLNCLNYYWFGRMIEAVRKRFVGGKKGVEGGKGDGMKMGEKGGEVVVVEGTEIKVEDIDIDLPALTGTGKRKGERGETKKEL